MLIFQEKQEKEEQERKQRIQLYVFVLRTIAYPFNCKQPTSEPKRQLKVTKESYDKSKSKVEVRTLMSKAFFHGVVLVADLLHAKEVLSLPREGREAING